ncbi:hypothetical protein Bca101_029870 [Brassica carinata]
MGFSLRCEVSRIYASASSSSPIQSVKSSDRSPSLQTKPCSSPSLSPSTPLFSPSPSTAFSFGGTRLRCLILLVTSCVASVQITVANGSAQLLLLWRDSRFATVFLSRDAWLPTPSIFSRYGKDSVFSKADPLALRLLERLLAFDPKDRASAEDALSDPYFSGLSNSEREPSTQPISKLEFDFERKKLTNDDVRD